jgi:hypothetical protein
MRLLVKATLVLAMGAVAYGTPSSASATPRMDDPCVVIGTGICFSNWEEVCMQYCQVYDPNKAFCNVPPNTTLYCNGAPE